MKRQVVGHDELNREREERIERLKNELSELKVKHEELEIEKGTLKINYAKVMELYEICQRDLDDTTEKLHQTNKVRHETEIKLGEEIQKTKGLQEVVKLKDESLTKKA